MAIRHIVVQVDTDRACRDRLTYALGLAGRCGASVEAVFARQPPNIPMVAEAGIAAEAAESQRAAADATAAAAKETFQDAAAGTPDATWVAEDGLWADVLTQRAYGADLLVVGQHDPQDREATTGAHLVTDVTLSAGRPVLVLPSRNPRPEAGAEPIRRVIVAWKSRREAARAAADAQPLLAAAEIEVFRVVPRGAPADVGNGTDIATYLSRHGLDIRHHVEPATDKPVWQTVLDRAGAFNADLLVMGGYSHSRLRQAILGGMTREVLRHMTLPVLLSN